MTIYLMSYITQSVADSQVPVESDEEIISPSRLKQSIKDVPSSVTVIRKRDIKELGVESIAEVMRLVPGMSVIKVSGNDYRIEYHGTNGLVPRRMQLLIDGVSWYRVGYAQIDWETLPVTVDEIERIEVTRSPNSATYGANSFAAIINIITTHPSDNPKTSLTTRVGTQDRKSMNFVYSDKFKSTAYAIALYKMKNSGYDKNATENRQRIDSIGVNRLTFKSNSEISGNTNVKFNAGISDAEMDNEYGDADQITNPEKTKLDRYAQLSMIMHGNSNKLELNAYYTEVIEKLSWDTCKPRIMLTSEAKKMFDSNPQYFNTILRGGMPEGGSALDDEIAQELVTEILRLGENATKPVCGTINGNQEERRLDIDAHWTKIISNDFRFVVGANYRRDSMTSETYLNGEIYNDSFRTYSSAEYKPIDALVLNVSGMFEADKGKETKTYQFMPRLSANYHINRHGTVRFIYSKATRTPNFLETDREWNYTARNITPNLDGVTTAPFFYTAHSTKELKPEIIESKEISYYYKSRVMKATADVKIFEENRYNLISEKLQYVDYQPTNEGTATLKGLEFEMRKKFTKNIKTHMSYAYIKNSTNNFYEETLHAEQNLSASLIFSGPKKETLALTTYYEKYQHNGIYRAYELSGTVVRKKAGNDISLGVKLRYNSSLPSYVRNETESVKSEYINPLQILTTVSLAMD